MSAAAWIGPKRDVREYSSHSHLGAEIFRPGSIATPRLPRAITAARATALACLFTLGSTTVSCGGRVKHDPPPPSPAPEPGAPEPGAPEPGAPEPGVPEPNTPEPNTPEPNTPEPALPEGWPADGSSILEDYEVAGELCGNQILYGPPFSDEALFGLRGTVDGEPVTLVPSEQDLSDCSKECVRLGVLANPVPDAGDVPTSPLRLQLAQLSVRLDAVGPWIATFQVGRPARKAASDPCKLLVSTTGPQPAEAEGTLVTTFILAPDGMERGNAVGVLDVTLSFPDPDVGLVSKELHLELALPWAYRIATPKP